MPSPDNVIALGLLVLLQAVLGFDNLLYISIESKKAPPERQASIRRVGIALAMLLRIVLLFVLLRAIGTFQSPLITADVPGVVRGSLNLHSIIVLLGGAFILYTSIREILHMVMLGGMHEEAHSRKTAGAVLVSIVAMNLVFSFDSILSAMALSDVFWVMATAIVVGAGLMIALADRVSEFLQKNRAYEILGLFVLFVVGIMLLTEGGHLAHLHLFGHPITPMSKTTFYFVIGVLVITDIAQSRFQRRLLEARR